MPANSITKSLDQFNRLTIITEILVALSVGGFLTIIVCNKWLAQFHHWTLLEIVWTVSPIVVLVLLGFPSLKNLYIIESRVFNILNLKVLGHQWYWEYSIPEVKFNIDCYPLIKSSLYRMGETETLVLPFLCKIRALITSQDVIHSWCLPSLGFKLDACPGRLNYFIFRSCSPSFIVGQCSELCGTFHSWMPIKLEFTSRNLFLIYLKAL